MQPYGVIMQCYHHKFSFLFTPFKAGMFYDFVQFEGTVKLAHLRKDQMNTTDIYYFMKGIGSNGTKK